MSSCMFLQYQELIVPFFFHINVELSYGDNCLLVLLASLRPVSSRPWPIFYAKESGKIKKVANVPPTCQKSTEWQPKCVGL